MSMIRYHGLEIEVRELPERRYVPKPTADLLNGFENESGLRLPSSFRDFALLFGPGELGGFYRIASPTPEQVDYELKQFNAGAHGPPEDRLWDSYSAGVDHVYFFAATVGGVLLAWKRNEITEVAHHEYRIYALPGFGQMEAVASTFAEFVVEAMTQRPSSEDGSWPNRVFSRFVLS